jgi:hypothetical protein
MKWYELDRGRLVLERMRVLRVYPQFTLKRDKYGSLFWSGEVDVAVGSLGIKRLELQINYPDSFPASYPEAYVISPELPPEEVGHKWHRWPADGTVCYVKPKDWQIGVTADEVIAKVVDWYFNYVAVKNGLIKDMPEVGRAVIS